MKTSVNKVELNGFLGQDATYKELKNGRNMVNLRIATNESYKDKSGEKVSNTAWHNVILWKEPEKGIKDSLKKGTRVAITGKLNYGKYTAKDGQVRYTTDIVAYKVEIEDAKPKNE